MPFETHYNVRGAMSLTTYGHVQKACFLVAILAILSFNRFGSPTLPGCALMLSGIAALAANVYVRLKQRPENSDGAGDAKPLTSDTEDAGLDKSLHELPSEQTITGRLPYSMNYLWVARHHHLNTAWQWSSWGEEPAAGPASSPTLRVRGWVHSVASAEDQGVVYLSAANTKMAVEIAKALSPHGTDFEVTLMPSGGLRISPIERRPYRGLEVRAPGPEELRNPPGSALIH